MMEKHDLLYMDTNPFYEVSLFSPSHLPGTPFPQVVTMRLTLSFGTQESVLGAEIRDLESCLNLALYSSEFGLCVSMWD